MTGLLDIGLSAAGGGLFGIIGSIGGRVMGFFERKEQNKHDLKLLEHKERQNDHDIKLRKMDNDHEKQLHELNMEAARQKVEDDLAVNRQTLSYEGMAASFAHDASAGKTSIWVNNWIRITRPILTKMLWVLVLIIFLKTKSPDLQFAIVQASVFAATAATLWWFGDRPNRSNTYNTGLNHEYKIQH